MKRVQTKHIVKVEEVFRRGDMEYIVMELAEMDMLELVNGANHCGWFVSCFMHPHAHKFHVNRWYL